MSNTTLKSFRRIYNIVKEIDQDISDNSTVIIAPLNWGLGHASRCIPIIQYLVPKVKKVILVSNGISYDFLKTEFPNLPIYNLKSPEISYPYESMLLNGLIQLPRFFMHLRHDRKMAADIVTETKADIIISDNRFSFYDSRCTNIYITHQVNIHHKNKLFAWIASMCHQSMIKRFDICWIPDHEIDDQALAGHLSRCPQEINHRYIGPMTRLCVVPMVKNIDVLIILSGPEPQRSTLEKVLSEAMFNINVKWVFVRGTNRPSDTSYNANIIDIGDSMTINDLFCRSKLVICRSGYSTLMDLEKFDSTVLLIPTPGQSEQIYLSTYWTTKMPSRYKKIEQEELTPSKAGDYILQILTKLS